MSVDAEAVIKRLGFHEQFSDAIDGLTGPREHMAYVFLAGAGAFERDIRPKLDEILEKIRTKNGRYPEAGQPS